MKIFKWLLTSTPILPGLTAVQQLVAKANISKELGAQSPTSPKGCSSVFQIEILGISDPMLDIAEQLKTYEALVASGLASHVSLPHFWLLYKESLPTLFDFSMMCCCVPGSSVSVERLFSYLGVIYGNKRRGRLLSSFVKSMITVQDVGQGEITKRSFPSRYTLKFAEVLFEDALFRLHSTESLAKPAIFDQTEEEKDGLDDATSFDVDF